MIRFRHVVEKILEYVLIVLMGTNVLNVLWQVFTRFVLRNPSSYTEELARYLLVWIGLLGGAYAVSKKIHLAIDLLPNRLKGRARLWLALFIEVSILLFALFVMIIGGIRLVTITLTLHQISAALQIKLGYVYLMLPVSGILILFFCLCEISGLLRASEEKPLATGHTNAGGSDVLD